MGEPSVQLTSVFLIFLSVFLIDGEVTNGESTSTSLQVLEDFSKAEQDGFPVGWQASRTESVTRKAYVVARDGEQSVIGTNGVDVQTRIGKPLAGNPKEYSIV